MAVTPPFVLRHLRHDDADPVLRPAGRLDLWLRATSATIASSSAAIWTSSARSTIAGAEPHIGTDAHGHPQAPFKPT